MSTERLERLRHTLEGYVEREELPGAVALVARRGEVVFLEAVGHRDREAGDAQATDDIFRIASQTKALVSVAIMILQERGELLISHPLGSEGEYGWGGAYHSTYWVDPAEELVVVYFTQPLPAIEVDDQDRLRAPVYQAIVER